MTDTMTLYARLSAPYRDIPALLERTGLPAECEALAAAYVSVALDGVRQALQRWAPRPPIEPDEELAFAETLDAAMVARVTEALSPLIDARDRAAARTQADLQGWARERAIARDLPEAAIARMIAGDTPDVDHFTWETLQDGRRVPHYTVRPSREQ